MMKRRSLLQWVGILLTLSVVLAYAAVAQESKGQPSNAAKKRADIITIDTLRAFGNLERGEVEFLHDTHTDALEKKNKDCSVCHLSEKERTSPKFKRLQDVNKDQVMNTYHVHCMACHGEMTGVGEKTGPVEQCGDCHKGKGNLISSRRPMGFDRSLHFRHSEASKDKCELCHHEYDEKGKKLYYAKEKEGSCRFCHKQVTEQNRISMRLASHVACIDCHKKNLAEAKKAAPNPQKKLGPMKCGGCHELSNQQRIEKVKLIPRMNRKQPDVVLLQTEKKAPGPLQADARMNPVPFDHKAHEEYNDTCRVCHHASMESCSKSCHTSTGTKEGKDIKVERAMHQTGSRKSCVGCHETALLQKECAGCHADRVNGGKLKDWTCIQCHMKPLQQNPGAPEKPEQIAGMLLKARQISANAGIYKDEDIPEKVLIKDLSEQYEAVELPHRKIVHALSKKIKENKLASVFHSEEGRMCQGCHHNSPAAKNPPRCASCHGKPFDPKNLLMPGIKAAYHQQCLGCHKEMGIQKPSPTACAECHKEKKVVTTSGLR